MPRVVIAPEFGAPDVLSVIDQPTPVPGPGEVVLDVRAAGTNPVDYKRFSGAMGADPSQLPMRVGLEAAGVVSSLGPDVQTVAVGDEVIGHQLSGAFADQVVAPAARLVAKPAQLSWEEAGGLLLTGATAMHALTVVAVAAGDTVLIHGGSGGVGVMAVQLAVARGARVIATASASNHDFVRALGAEPTSYGPGLADRVRGLAPAGVDAAVDTVGTDEAIEVSLQLVAERNRIVTIAGFRRAAADGIKLIGGAPGADPGTEIRAAARQQLVDLVTAGQLRVFVAASYPLTATGAALTELAAGHTRGKIVVVP